MTDKGFEFVEKLTIAQRLALTSYDIRFTDDGQEQEVTGILPMLWQYTKDLTDHAAYDGAIAVKIIADDHPRLRWLLRPLHRGLHRIQIR